MMRRLTWRAITVQGPQVGLAIVRGECPYVGINGRLLQEGWYYLHVRATDLPEADSAQDLFAAAWPGAPDALPRSCIIGRVRLGRRVARDSVQSTWGFAVGGPDCRIVEESVELQTPVPDVKGSGSLWYVQHDDTHALLRDLLPKGVHRTFAHFPDVLPEPEQSQKRGFSSFLKWVKKPPRKTRSDCGVRREPAAAASTRLNMERSYPSTDAPPPSKRCRVGAAPHEESREMRPANAPATMVLEPGEQDSRALRWKPLAARFAAGRTLPRLLQLMRMHPLKVVPSGSASAPVRPAAGLFTTIRGEPVWIVGTFTRRNTKLADVVPLRSSGGRLGQRQFVARYSEVRSVQQSDQGEVGLFFRALPRRSSGCRLATLNFVRRQLPGASQQAGDIQVAQTVRILAESWGSSINTLATESSVTISHAVRQIVPSDLREHMEVCRARGEEHAVVRRHDRAATRRVLEIPLPIEVDCRIHRCMTCQRQGNLRTCYQLTEKDWQAEFPGLLRHQAPCKGTHWMTRRFLLYFVQSFIEKLNVREVRRALAEYYSTNALALSGGARGLSYLSAVPSCHALRSILCLALYNFLKVMVRQWRKPIHVYSGTAWRGDGNYDIATRIATYDAASKRFKRPFSVILAWCAVDGALLDYPRASPTEAIEDIIADLDPKVDECKDDRLEAGLDLADCLPASHSTDSYLKHRLKLQAFYEGKAAALTPAVQSATPKGDAIGAAGNRVGILTEITGDLLHDFLGMKRCVPVLKCDTRDILEDYKDSLTRLSAKPADIDPAVPGELPDSGLGLLVSGIRDDVASFKAKLATDAAGSAALKTFLAQPNVTNAKAWKSQYNAYPPRGVVARLARRCQVKLHTSSQYCGYNTLGEFKKEMKRVRRWYKTQKKKTRRWMGIHRDLKQTKRVSARGTVMSAKVRAHFRRLF